MKAYRYAELPSPEWEYPPIPTFVFSHCQNNRDAYCSRYFTRKNGTRVYCKCECHAQEAND